MSINTFAELKTAIANFLARDDLTNRIPEFIELAEGRINRELETREQEKRATATLSSGNEYVSLPADLRQIRSVKLNQTPIVTLTYLSPDQLDQEYSSDGSGTPASYSIVGQEIKIRPKPDSTMTAEIIYIGNVDALSDANTSTTLLIRSPDVYLFGALHFAYDYLLDTANAQLYNQKFNNALESVRYDEQRSTYSQGRLQMRSDYQRQISLR